MSFQQDGPRIVGVLSGFPSNYYAQSELTQMLIKIWKNQDLDPNKVEKFHQNLKVNGRYLALKIEEY